MKRALTWTIATLCLMLSYGCATPDKLLTAKNLNTAPGIKIVREECADLRKITTASQAAAFSGIMFGAIGGALGGAVSLSMEAEGGKQLTKDCQLPDYSKLVMDAFLDRIGAELPEWPNVSFETAPVPEDYRFVNGYLIVVRVTVLAVQDGKGLTTVTTGTMYDPSHKEVWFKRFIFTSLEHNRSCAMTELIAEEGKVMKDDYLFAANETASSLILHLKTGQPSS